MFSKIFVWDALCIFDESCFYLHDYKVLSFSYEYQKAIIGLDAIIVLGAKDRFKFQYFLPNYRYWHRNNGVQMASGTYKILTHFLWKIINNVSIITMWVILLEKVKRSVKIRKLHHLTVIQPLKQGEDNTCNITLQHYSKIEYKYDNGKSIYILSSPTYNFLGIKLK